MRTVRCILAVVGISLVLAGASGAAEELELRGSWWEGPAEQTRRTTLVASFDSATSNDADYARGDARSGGFGMNPDVPGRHGRATRIAEIGGHVHFPGGSNLNPDHGTVRLLVRGTVWQDETPRWLFEARGLDRIGIRRDTKALSLVFSPDRRVDQPIAQLDLPLGNVSTDEWHCVVASWDRATGRGWIALDGRGVGGEMTFPDRRRATFVMYVGGGIGGRMGGLNEPGLEIDDLVIYDVPLPMLEAELRPLPEEDQAFLPQAEDAARKCLNLVADLQRWGGWMTIHTWPTLIGSYAQGREHVDYDEAIGNDKSHATPYIAARFLYAYEILGDYRFFEVARRTGEFLLAAQDPRGFWVHGYKMTVYGIKPNASESHIKFQDSVQSHPIFLFAYLHRLTGDERYLEALKRAGEFYLAAQNPNGSWSHHFDATKGIGATATGLPQGGELNDLAMNDAIDIMVLMYHVTGEAKYLQAIKRAGEWLIGAQGTGAARGWADQYDEDDSPTWARHFEPPAYGTTATRLACRALREVYRISKDERYLQPIRECVAWLKAKYPDGKMPCFVEPGTGKRIASWQRKIYYLDDPEQLAWLKRQPTGVWYYQLVSITSSIESILADAEAPRIVPEVTAETAGERLPALRASAQTAMESQNEAGVWVVPKVAGFMGSVGVGFSTSSPRVLFLLRYAEAARIAAGELAPAWRGEGNLLRMAYPKDDWYEVAWEEVG